jgi:hypothetical protein
MKLHWSFTPRTRYSHKFYKEGLSRDTITASFGLAVTEGNLLIMNYK